MYSEKNPKIDIYVDGYYQCSTNWSKTTSEAKRKYCQKHNIKESKVTAVKTYNQ